MGGAFLRGVFYDRFLFVSWGTGCDNLPVLTSKTPEGRQATAGCHYFSISLLPGGHSVTQRDRTAWHSVRERDRGWDRVGLSTHLLFESVTTSKNDSAWSKTPLYPESYVPHPSLSWSTVGAWHWERDRSVTAGRTHLASFYSYRQPAVAIR